eukprot:1161710-Pelagomonas_calceolata.AAC.12
MQQAARQCPRRGQQHAFFEVLNAQVCQQVSMLIAAPGLMMLGLKVYFMLGSWNSLAGTNS